MKKNVIPLSPHPTLRSAAAVLLTLMAGLAAVGWARPALGAAPQGGARILLLMVWDGLRPDAVSPTATPNLYKLTREGVYFADHHAMYPSQTMVNAATLATAAPPSANGITDNKMYLAPLLAEAEPAANAPLARALAGPVSLERSRLLVALSGQQALDGNLVEVRSIAQRLLRDGGFAGIVGKSGPTFLFDSRAGEPDREISGSELFLSDDRAEPAGFAQEIQGRIGRVTFKKALAQDPPFGEQDSFLAQAFIDHVLPAAAAALKQGRPAMLVLWQHNPDITQHAEGLGTAPYGKALAICDANLGKVRAALQKLGIADRTDLVVVSDHGFATIKERVDLAGLLVAHGLKRSATSKDVIVARNFGTDAIYLSPDLKGAARTALLRKIVSFAAAQKWCGPIFSRPGLPLDSGYLGTIPGTFNQAWFNLLNPARSPDLFISFRELDESNRRLMGPSATAYVLGASGLRTEPNRSRPAVHPMPGVMYADAGPGWSTGDGNHGALGTYEMHNFGAAIGPDFRSGYFDHAPTSNLDVARTILALLHLKAAIAPAIASFPRGRVIAEALKGGAAPRDYHHTEVSATLNLAGRRVISTIAMERMDGEKYLAGSTTRWIGQDGKAPAH